MPYDEALSNRIRESLAAQRKVEEKKMFRGICFMVNGKMCICVGGEEMMCRVGPDNYAVSLERNGTRPMIHNGRSMKGFIYVEPAGYKAKKDYDYFVKLALDFNRELVALKLSSKKKKAGIRKR